MRDQATRLRVTFLTLTAVAVVCGASTCFAQRRVTLSGHIGDIACVRFSPDGKYLASVVPSDSVKIWNVETKELIVSLGDRHNDAYSSVAFSPDGYFFAAAGGTGGYSVLDRRYRTRPGNLVLWDQNGAATPLSGHTGTVYTVTFSRDGRLLASGGKDGIIRLWDASAARLVRQLRGHRGDVQALAFSPDGGLLASGGKDRRVYLWPIDE